MAEHPANPEEVQAALAKAVSKAQHDARKAAETATSAKAAAEHAAQISERGGSLTGTRREDGTICFPAGDGRHTWEIAPDGTVTQRR